MCNKEQLMFALFMLYSLADKWGKTPAKVYQILNKTGIMAQQKKYKSQTFSIPKGIWILAEDSM